MLRRPFAIACIVVFGLAAIVGLGTLIYYQTLKSSPQYSLALLVDAAKRDDKQAINGLIDIDAVVDEFMPQIVKKAVELYGRGMPDVVVQKIAKLAEPLMPAVKDRARAQLALVIRDRTERFGEVPFFMMVLGAERYLDFDVTGDTATVRSKSPERRLELKMKRVGDRWRIVGIRDDKLATDIARSIGQQIIEIAQKGLTDQVADSLGVGKLADLFRQAEELVK
jgi:hypothetical protein